MPGTCEPTAQRHPPFQRVGAACGLELGSRRAEGAEPARARAGARAARGPPGSCALPPAPLGPLEAPPPARLGGDGEERAAAARPGQSTGPGARGGKRGRRLLPLPPPPLPPGGRARRAPQTAAPREQPGEPPSCLPASGRRRDDNQGLAPKRGSVRRLCFLTFFGGGKRGVPCPPSRTTPNC